MPATKHHAVLAILFATALLGTACGSVGGGDADNRQAAGDVTGQVVRVELFDQHLLVRNTYDRVIRVRFERDTPVHYRGGTYTPQNLEPGDQVRVDVLGDQGGILVATQIHVLESVQERGGGVDPPADIDEITAEVTRVEQLPNLLVVDSAERGTLRIAYSADTPVYYRGDRYAVSNLEPGDEIRVEVRRDEASGDLRTDYIAVTRSVQEREGIGTTPPGATDEREGVETFTGRVTLVEPERGRFTVTTDDHGRITVLMPYRSLTADREGFERLRTGDRVRFDAEWLGSSRAELVRFDLGY